MRSAIVLPALVVALTACAGPGATTTTVPASVGPTTTTVPPPTAPTTTEAGDLLPPHTDAALIELLDQLVEPLGFRMTRAALVDMTSYRASPEGRHLAVYVAPVAELTASEHAEAFIPLARAFLPLVFERWPGLESFDICQEPYAWPGDGTPPAVTILDLDRATAGSIDWETIDLPTIIAMAGTEPRLTVTANPEVSGSEPWAAAG
jgi:hypothetical protein